ncbi:MAG: SDR family oxidoreductase [Pseudomonadota bacterium]|nr:SDR family oxidoreductase [Pseudomonadota bacterium]
MSKVLITGASRGLGFEFVRQYAHDGWHVFATCRNPENAKNLLRLMEKIENISIHKMDVESHESINSCAFDLSKESIDLLINNAGIASNNFSTQKLGNFDFDFWEKILKVNTLGPLKISEAFLGQIMSSEQKKIAVVSSKVGSLSDMNDYPVYPYATSKAALNKGMRMMAEQLKDRGISVICLCPGHAKTDMGLMADGANVEVDAAVRGMREIINKLNIHSTGLFKQFDGKTLLW